MGFKIHFVVDADYIWVSGIGKLDTQPFVIRERCGDIKIVAYKDNISIGAAIITVGLADGNVYPPLSLTQPRDGFWSWGKPVKIAGKT